MAKSTKPITIPFAALRGVLGKPITDPALAKLTAQAGKVRTTPDHVIAKDAGFELALSRPEGAKRNAPKIVSTMFLSPQFAALPYGLAFTTREQLLATMPPPVATWKLGEFDLPVTTPDAYADRWDIDGVEVTAEYRDDRAVKMIVVTLRDEDTGGRDLSTHPLHFATKPADAPPDAELVGMALLVAWGADRFGLPAKHATTELGKQLRARKITPRAFLIGACNKTLTTLDFDPKLGGFLYAYTNRLSGGDGREACDKQIKKLLHLHRDDERAFTDDFLGTFSQLDSPFHVPDSWAAVDRLGAVLDARWADYEATKFRAPPNLALYENAAKLRDERKVTAARATLATASADAALAADLIALIDRPLTDKAVKAVLERAGMPIGKKIDQQANPALGVAYMGTKIEIAGKRVLGVDAVWFYAAKQKSYIRGIGAEVEFRGYPGELPHGLAFGDTRAAVIGKLGKPAESGDNNDLWYPTKTRRIACSYQRDKLVEVNFGKPRDW